MYAQVSVLVCQKTTIDMKFYKHIYFANVASAVVLISNTPDESVYLNSLQNLNLRNHSENILCNVYHIIMEICMGARIHTKH